MGLTNLLGGIGKKAKKAAAVGVVGLASLLSAGQTEAAPIVRVVPEKQVVSKGESSYFDVYIDSNGERVFAIDTDIIYSDNKLNVTGASILNDGFWQDKALDSISTVNGYSANRIGFDTTTYSSLAGMENVNNAAFRVNFTAGDVTGITNISLYDPDWQFYTSVLARNSNGTFTNYNTFSENLEMFGASVSVVDTVPEPSSLALLAAGAAGLGYAGRRKR